MRNKKYQLLKKKQKKYSYSRNPYKNNNKFIKIQKYILKGITILLLFISFIVIKKNNNKDNKDYKDNKDNKDNNTDFKNIGEKKYFTCFATMVKMDNRYIRETIEYYLKLGVEKFYFADDNSLNGEKVSDVLQDYIDKGIVEVKDLRGQKWKIVEYYEYALVHLRDKCTWIIYFDVDEFLEFKNKSMTIKDYLTMDNFKKCDLIKIHWLMYYDNDLVYYENKPLEERFTKPEYNSHQNRYHKSILKAKDYGEKMWGFSVHQPNESFTYSCDATGSYYKMPRPDMLGYPNYKYGYIKHYSMKTAEEFARKLLRGDQRETVYDREVRIERVEDFFSHNKFTEEKLPVIEKIINMTIPKYHNNNGIK